MILEKSKWAVALLREYNLTMVWVTALKWELLRTINNTPRRQTLTTNLLTPESKGHAWPHLCTKSDKYNIIAIMQYNAN